MKRFILGILTSLLTAALCSAIVTVVLNQTVLNADYLKGKLTAVNGYDRLSSALSNDVVQQAGLANNPQATATVQGIVNPVVVKQKINSALDEVQNYYQGKGSAPRVDFTDLVNQAQAAGIPITQNSDLTQPVTLGGSNAKTTGQSINFSGLRAVAIVASLALLLLVGVLSVIWRRYTAIPSVLISVGLFTACIAAAAYFVPVEASRLIKFSSNTDTLATLGRDLTQAISRDLVWQFGVVAGACLVVGIAARIWTGRLQKRLVISQAQISAVPQRASK